MLIAHCKLLKQPYSLLEKKESFAVQNSKVVAHRFCGIRADFSAAIFSFV